MANALPLLLLGGAAVLMMSGKKKRKTTTDKKTPSGGIANPAATYCIEHGGKYDIREDGEGNQYGVCVFPDGKEVQAGAFFKGEAQPEFPDHGIGKGTSTPWFLVVYYQAQQQVEERAKECSNPDAFRAAVLPALEQRIDEYRKDATDARHADVAAGGSGSGSRTGFAEGGPGGLAYESDLQMLIDNLFTVHCG